MTAGSMAGYSRTPRKEYPMIPNIMIRIEQTMAKTGRRRESSDRFMSSVGLCQRHLHAGPQKEDGGCDHRIPGFQPADDLNIGAVPHARLYLAGLCLAAFIH